MVVSSGVQGWTRKHGGGGLTLTLAADWQAVQKQEEEDEAQKEATEAAAGGAAEGLAEARGYGGRSTS